MGRGHGLWVFPARTLSKYSRDRCKSAQTPISQKRMSFCSTLFSHMKSVRRQLALETLLDVSPGSSLEHLSKKSFYRAVRMSRHSDQITVLLQIFQRLLAAHRTKSRPLSMVDKDLGASPLSHASGPAHATVPRCRHAVASALSALNSPHPVNSHSFFTTQLQHYTLWKYSNTSMFAP